VRCRRLVSAVHQRLQEEVSEIAEVLARWHKKSHVDVWQEALHLHRVRYETVVLLEPEPEKFPRRKTAKG
jgi:hypothetical protein